jgi:flagellar protein FliS
MDPLGRAQAAYRSVQVTTCSPPELVVMLYDGVFRFVNEARAALAAGDRARFGERISRAHAVVECLAATVDPKHDPSLAERLGGIYTFCMERLIEANLRRDPGILEEVLVALAPLRDAWRVVAGTHGAPSPPGEKRVQPGLPNPTRAESAPKRTGHDPCNHAGGNEHR